MDCKSSPKGPKGSRRGAAGLHQFCCGLHQQSQRTKRFSNKRCSRSAQVDCTSSPRSPRGPVRRVPVRRALGRRVPGRRVSGRYWKKRRKRQRAASAWSQGTLGKAKRVGWGQTPVVWLWPGILNLTIPTPLIGQVQIISLIKVRPVILLKYLKEH